MSSPGFYIHETAVVDEGAKIGDNTRIWHFSHLMPRSVIGAGCNIGQNVFIDNDVVLGKRVKVQNNVSIYNGVLIEDDVFLGPSAVFTNVTNPRSFIERKQEFRRTLVRRGATIGANATIVCGVEIGAFAFIGAGAVITRDVKPFALMTGCPARQTGWMSEDGHKLVFNEEGIAFCQPESATYRLENGWVSKNP